MLIEVVQNFGSIKNKATIHDSRFCNLGKIILLDLEDTINILKIAMGICVNKTVIAMLAVDSELERYSL